MKRMMAKALTIYSLLLLSNTVISYLISPFHRNLHNRIWEEGYKTLLVLGARKEKCTSSDDSCVRRIVATPGSMRRNVINLGLISLGSSLIPTRVDATYSAYSAREKDWIERKSKGEVNISTPKDLRRQLREIAPMNDDSKSKIFCPNGPSAAVSPLMENKCGDKIATPSVYGRTQDIAGNSIPGFNYNDAAGSNPLLNSGFPSYNTK